MCERAWGLATAHRQARRLLLQARQLQMPPPCKAVSGPGTSQAASTAGTGNMMLLGSLETPGTAWPQEGVTALAQGAPRSELPKGPQLFTCSVASKGRVSACLCYSSLSATIWQVPSSCPAFRKNELHREVEGEQDKEELYQVIEQLRVELQGAVPCSQVVPTNIQLLAERVAPLCCWSSCCLPLSAERRSWRG